jgi:hypothetical protein
MNETFILIGRAASSYVSNLILRSKGLGITKAVTRRRFHSSR